MVAFNSLLSLAVPILAARAVCALDLDVEKEDSIKSVAKTLATAIVDTYNLFQKSEEADGSGLFGEPYYWWETGAVFNALIEYSHLTGDTQFDDLVTKAVVHQIGDYDAFMPPNQTKSLGNDDQSTWGLAALTAAEVGRKDPEEFRWLDAAKNVFDSQVARWDEDFCGGGLRWQIFTFNEGYNYKNSWSNGQFFLLAARLADLTGNRTYSEWAEKVYDWSATIGLVDEKNWTVYDGMDTLSNCSSVNHIQWSAMHAIYVEGAAFMWNFTTSEKWKDAVSGFAGSSPRFQDKESGVLLEVACEANGKCDYDQRTFKGTTARSYSRATKAAPFASDLLDKVVEASAKAAANGCEGEGADLACRFQWADEDSETSVVKSGGLGEAFNALEAVQGLLYSGVNLVSNEARENAKSNSTPTAKASGTPSGTPSGTLSGSAAPAKETGAAGRATAAWSAFALAGMVAVMGF